MTCEAVINDTRERWVCGRFRFRGSRLELRVSGGPSRCPRRGQRVLVRCRTGQLLNFGWLVAFGLRGSGRDRLVILGASLGEVEERASRPRSRQVVQVLINYNLFGNESHVLVPIGPGDVSPERAREARTPGDSPGPYPSQSVPGGCRVGVRVSFGFQREIS